MCVKEISSLLIPPIFKYISSDEITIENVPINLFKQNVYCCVENIYNHKESFIVPVLSEMFILRVSSCLKLCINYQNAKCYRQLW